MINQNVFLSDSGAGPGKRHSLFVLIVFLAILDASSQDTIPQGREIVIASVGDIMPGTSFPGRRYLPPGDNPWPLIESVSEYLSNADLTFGNLEGAFSDSARLEKKCRDTTRCYAFRVPEKYAAILDRAGFDLISLANNHIGDFGYDAKKTTAGILDSLKITYAGTEEYPLAIRKLDTLLIGFCAFAPNKGTVNLHNLDEAVAIVKSLEDSCDIVIVSVHGGAEGADHQNISREEEFYYGENRGNMYEFTHAMIDAGADLVLGHGPHVSRAIELYRGRLIAYSLGNFCTYGRFNLKGPNGFAPVLITHLDKEGEFVSGKIIPVYQDNSGHVRPDPQKRAIFKIRDLTLNDFPETGISINNDGIITRK